jgi:N-acetylglucosamine malate deacetylase 1
MVPNDQTCDILAFGAHPDDLEVAMGGTTAKLARQGLRVLFVDLTDGEPARYAQPHVRREQAVQAAASSRIPSSRRMTQRRRTPRFRTF